MPHGFRSDYEAGETAQDWREQLEPAQRSLVGFARLYRDRFERGVLEEDCLLYTSPSPRDRTRSRMPSSA